IDMGSNNLNNVGAVNAQTGNFSGNVNGVNGTFSGQVKGNSGNFDVNVTAGGDIRSNNGWLITRNSKGWLNETHGGGFYMSDGSWVRSVNNKGIYTGGQVKGGTVRADGRLYTGEYLQLERTAVAGASCSPNGLVGRDNTGAILSCQSGTWRKVGSGELQIATAQATGWRFPGATATCPTGKRVTGGGGICTSRTGYIWLTRSFPSANNSWSAACDTTEDQNGSITVYAICQ
ncbi:TPA: shufflon system plasmid conjugative transfer pilus tip adhesin PilV, partial [Salmonella enterica subsp. enterica serovar Derby]|nr:shufflon system plasmid conjugative transfer pilus tip adhesin PilV [Salmonella enterica subsp. enterica serovar Derby]